jgi:hypothetical protein
MGGGREGEEMHREMASARKREGGREGGREREREREVFLTIAK